MSHSSIRVCLPKGTQPEDVEQAVAEALAPFDENTEVEPYRSYEDGGPADYWWVRSVRRGAEHHRNGTGIRPYSPDGPGVSSSSSRHTEDEQRAKLADDAAWAERLGDQPTWGDVVEAYNAKYHPLVPATGDEPGESDSRLYYEAETDRAYTLSTYNPRSRWDWYQIGGRWRWSLLGRWGVDRSALVLTELKGGANRYAADQWEIEERIKAGLPIGPEYGPNGGLWCDGGERGLLDFEAMRALAAAEADAGFDVWEQFWFGLSVEARESAKPWSYFRTIMQADGYDHAGSQAMRDRYHGQLWYVAASMNPRLRDAWDCPLDKYGMGRERFVAAARVAAVPGWALLTLDGEWIEKGRMGWFGMSDSTDDSEAAYREAANRYFDELDPEALIVTVDVHI